MSVRRLAKEQPASFAFSPQSLEKAHWWLAKFPEGRKQSAVIPLLWLVQKQEGWVPEPAGNGGLRRGWPFLPSRLSSSAISSPQM
jgi:NADH-quinone oxidoreductase subunit E